MNLGFWAITLSTEIATDIRVNGSDTDKRTIYVKATDHSGEPLSRILFRPTICLVLLRVIK